VPGIPPPPDAPADLLAWHIRRWYDADVKGDKFESAALSLLRTIPFWGMLHDSKSLAAISDVDSEQQMLRQIREHFSSCEFRTVILRAMDRESDN